jgi:hypothetical protein
MSENTRSWSPIKVDGPGITLSGEVPSHNILRRDDCIFNAVANRSSECSCPNNILNQPFPQSARGDDASVFGAVALAPPNHRDDRRRGRFENSTDRRSAGDRRNMDVVPWRTPMMTFQLFRFDPTSLPANNSANSPPEVSVPGADEDASTSARCSSRGAPRLAENPRN